MPCLQRNVCRLQWNTDRALRKIASRKSGSNFQVFSSMAMYLIIGFMLWRTYGVFMVQTLFDGESIQEVKTNLHKRHVTIIARADESLSVPQFQAFVHSLRAQTHKNFSLWIVNGENPSKKLFSREISVINDSRVSTLAFKFKRDKTFFHSYGYYTTDLAMRKLIAITDPNERNEFLLVTNGDNLYNHLFLENSLKLITNETCLVASDWISRYVRINETFPNRAGNIRFLEGGIDLGCVVTSLFHVHRSFNRRVFFKKHIKAADWIFFKKIVNRFGESCAIKTNQVLFMHQWTLLDHISQATQSIFDSLSKRSDQRLLLL